MKVRNRSVTGAYVMEYEYSEERGESIDESEWQELCERGRFHCKTCKELPPLEDIHIFIETGACSHCLDVERRFQAE
jgi:hypothetical protein